MKQALFAVGPNTILIGLCVVALASTVSYAAGRRSALASATVVSESARDVEPPLALAREPAPDLEPAAVLEEMGTRTDDVVALEAARRVVAAASEAKTWTREDAQTLRRLFTKMNRAQVDEIFQALFPALDRGDIVATYVGPPV